MSFFPVCTALLLAAFSFAAPAAKSAPAPKEPLTFRVRLIEDMQTLDWNYGEVNGEIVYQLMEGLFRTDGSGKAVAAATRSYKWNADKTQLTLQLKPELRWSDDAPVCAQQFVDSWARLRNKKFASPYAHYANVLKKFEAKSCRELIVSFERPAPEAPALFSHYVFFPVRLDQLEKQPKIFREGRELLVNGPFRLAERVANQRVVLERNPAYAGPAAKLERVEFLFVPDEATAKVMFEQKRFDWVKDVPSLLRTPAVEKGPDFKVFPAFTAFYFGLYPARTPILQDADVRRALSDSLDRGEIAKVLGRENQGTRAWVPDELLPGKKAPALAPGPTAFAAARAKLAAAGKNHGLVLRVYNKGAHKLLAEWAQGQWEKKLGLRIPIEVQEAKIYWREIYTDTPPIFLSGVTAPYAHPRAFLQEFLTPSTANWTGWVSADYDLAVAEERFADAEELLRAGGQVIPLYARDTAALVGRRWKGFSVNPLGQVFLREVHL